MASLFFFIRSLFSSFWLLSHVTQGDGGSWVWFHHCWHVKIVQTRKNEGVRQHLSLSIKIQYNVVCVCFIIFCFSIFLSISLTFSKRLFVWTLLLLLFKCRECRVGISISLKKQLQMLTSVEHLATMARSHCYFNCSAFFRRFIWAFFCCFLCSSCPTVAAVADQPFLGHWVANVFLSLSPKFLLLVVGAFVPEYGHSLFDATAQTFLLFSFSLSLFKHFFDRRKNSITDKLLNKPKAKKVPFALFFLNIV